MASKASATARIRLSRTGGSPRSMAGAAVATTVEATVMTGGNLDHRSQELDFVQDVLHQVGVVLHEGVLLLAERPLLPDERARHGQLADVVDEGGDPYPVEGVTPEPHLLGGDLAEVGDPLGVALGVEVFRLERLDEPTEGGLMRHPQLRDGPHRQVADQEYRKQEGQGHRPDEQVRRSQQAPQDPHQRHRGNERSHSRPRLEVALAVHRSHRQGDQAEIGGTVQEGRR